MLPMQTFNGSLTDSNRIDINLWRTLYFQLQTAYVGSGTNPLPAITTVNDTLAANSADTLPVPVAIVAGNYSSVKTNAFSSNLLSYNAGENKIYDVTSRTESPYQSNDLFAAAPGIAITRTGTVNFVCRNNFIYNNTGKSISQVAIDFDDGNGFTGITIGTPITVTYTTTGSKRWTVKVTLSDNTVLQCYSPYDVLAVDGNNSNTGYFAPPDIPQALSYSYSGGSSLARQYFEGDATQSGGYITIVYSNKNYTGTLRKPLVVLEGYDVYDIAPGLQGYLPYSFVDFIKAINEPTNLYDFNSRLDDTAGYDLVFVNYERGTDSVERNARFFKNVLDWVNTNKVADDRDGYTIQQNVVLGLSMGGLVARYALAQMTKNNQPTGTRLLITHDSPHQGANVPLGLQYFIRMLGNFQLFGTNIYDLYPQYKQVLGLLNAPATQELLQYTSTSTNSYTSNTFLSSTYRNMVTFSPADPQPTYRFIATSLGSECAHPLFDPGKTFFDFGAGVDAGADIRLLFFRIPIVSYYLSVQASAFALPAQGTVAKLASLKTVNQLTLFGFIPIVKQLYDGSAYSTGSELPVDGAPGSVYPLVDVQSIQNLTIPVLNPVSLSLYFPIGNFLGAYFDAWAYNQGFSYDFTFVPVASALDAAPYNTSIFSQPYVNGTNQTYPSASQTFIAQETVTPPTNSNATNNAHIRFTARNAHWMFNEMENLPNYLNCSSECSNTYYIEGNGIICANGSFYIPGLSAGVTIAWSVSPSGIASVSSNGNSVTLTKLTDGEVTLTASVSNVCGSNSMTLYKTVDFGLPQINLLPYETFISSDPSSFYYNPVCALATTDIDLDVTGAATVTWSKYTSPFNVNWSQAGNNLSFYFFAAGQTAAFRVDAANSCGTATEYFAFSSSDCSGGGGDPCGGEESFTVSPNPARGRVIIVPDTPPPCDEVAVNSTLSGTVQKTTDAKKQQDNNHNIRAGKTVIRSIRVYDMSGKLYQNQLYTGVSRAELDISRLANGVYILSISSGKTTVQKQLVVQH